MLNLQAFRLIHEVPGEIVIPLTRADVMEANPKPLKKSYMKYVSPELMNTVEGALKSAGSIKRIDLIDDLIRISTMSIVSAIAKLKVIGAVTTESYIVNGKKGVIYHYIEK